MNVPGWKTNRKLIVIESDDWGSIRMPSSQVYRNLLRDGIRVDKCPYCKYDSLESEEDLELLFRVLKQHKDSVGRNPVITANFVVANPNFEAIKKSEFEKYVYEPFTDTYKHFSRSKNSFEIINKGIKAEIFRPQLHGREHLNVNRWMRALRNGYKETLKAFNQNTFGISTTVTSEKRKSYLPAFDVEESADIMYHTDVINEAVDLFEKAFNFTPDSFVAPNYIWHKKLEQDLYFHNIKVIQSGKFQILPKADGSYSKKFHYTGQKNGFGAIYTTRNCLFEPSEDQKIDWVKNCLKDIERAFRWRKPAIITTHRLNFIGSVVEENRSDNLQMLSELLTNIKIKWPEVEFISTPELAKIIQKKN